MGDDLLDQSLDLADALIHVRLSKDVTGLGWSRPLFSPLGYLLCETSAIGCYVPGIGKLAR